MKTEETVGIAKTDIPGDFGQFFSVVRVLSAFHPLADQLAEDTAEIFMPCIA